MDLYSPKTMLRMVEQLPPLPSFIKDTFFRRTDTFSTESVMFDIVKNGRPMAPFVNPVIGNQVLERSGFETKEFTPPLVAPFRPITTKDIMTRMPGENPINGRSPNRRRAALLQNDLLELDSSISMREEWMAVKAIFEGKVIMRGKGVEREIDFQFENNVVVDVPWSDHVNSDPLRDIRRARKIAARSGYSPNILICDSDTMDDLLDNERVQRMLDNTGVRMGIVDISLLGNGATYYGFLRQSGVHLYSYDGEFADNDNENPDYPGVSPGSKDFIPKVYNFIPKGRVFIGSTGMPTSLLYGGIDHAENGFTSEPRVPLVWFNEKGTMQYVEISSRPLPCPKNVSSWVLLDVLGDDEEVTP